MSSRRFISSAQLALVVCMGALLLLVPASRAAQSSRAPLSDAAFWKIVEEASEPDGNFFSENFLSNEQGFQYVIPPLLSRLQPAGAYLGVGPEQNFTYVAALHPDIAFIIDIRRQNLIQHLLYKAVFEMSPNRMEFLSMLFCRKTTEPPGPDASATALFKAYSAVPQNAELYAENLTAVKDLLQKQHKFVLSEDDLVSLEHVYETIARQGTDLGYSVDTAALAARNNTNFRIMPADSLIDGGVPGIARINGEDVRVTLVPTNVPGAAGVLYGTSMPFPNYTKLMTATDGNGTNWSYLASEANYQAVRKMEQENRIVPIVGDFAGPKAIRAVAQYLKEHGTTVSVFYLSNVEQYLKPPELMLNFYKNVETLPLNPTSTFIRSTQANGTQPGVAQSSISPMREVLDAVLDGRVQSQVDILRLFR